MSHIDPVEYGARADTQQVEASQRPTDDDYGRFQALLDDGRDCDWDQEQLARRGRFRVLDPGFSAVLAASCADLALVAQAVGNYGIARQSAAESKQIVHALLRRSDDLGTAWAVDLSDGSEIRTETAGTALLTLMPDAPRRVVMGLSESVLSGELSSEYGVRSLAKSHQLVEPMRYWRGPVWANITWLCALGLERNGLREQADELRTRLLRAAASAGMREYYDAESGEGLGSHAFTWTAATVLASLSD